jgi:hypothetical protein
MKLLKVRDGCVFVWIWCGDFGNDVKSLFGKPLFLNYWLLEIHASRLRARSVDLGWAFLSYSVLIGKSV